ncbi:hypothetical protein [Streptacidiphilus sp. EB129]|uniref:zinc finger domain-containing protein n=1 Tax=Streptacidiphilus sp. EB129 TaxID=3156262 RepID=UPI003510D880
MEFYTRPLPRLSRCRDWPALADESVTLLVLSENGFISRGSGDIAHKRIPLTRLGPGDVVLALRNGADGTPDVVVVDDVARLCAGLDVRQSTVSDADRASALARAWRMTAEQACPACGVEPWQHCRNKYGDRMVTIRFHKARQRAADVEPVLKAAELHPGHWLEGTARFDWSPEPIPQR